MYFSELFKTVVYQFKMNISADILETDLLCTCVSSIMQSPSIMIEWRDTNEKWGRTFWNLGRTKFWLFVEWHTIFRCVKSVLFDVFLIRIFQFSNWIRKFTEKVPILVWMCKKRTRKTLPTQCFLSYLANGVSYDSKNAQLWLYYWRLIL